MSAEQTTDGAVGPWRVYYGDAWVQSDPPPPEQVVEWKRLGTEQRFTGRSADFDPAFNVAGLYWRSMPADWNPAIGEARVKEAFSNFAYSYWFGDPTAPVQESSTAAVPLK